MSIAADVCKQIRDKGFRGVAAKRFNESARRMKEGYVFFGEECTLAQYGDGSLAVFYPDGGEHQVAVIRRKVDQAKAAAFLDDEALGVGVDGVYLDWPV